MIIEIEHTTITTETLDSGKIRYNIQPDDGYLIYSKKELAQTQEQIDKGELDGDAFDYVYKSADPFHAPEDYDFNDIGVVKDVNTED